MKRCHIFPQYLAVPCLPPTYPSRALRVPAARWPGLRNRKRQGRARRACPEPTCWWVPKGGTRRAAQSRHDDGARGYLRVARQRNPKHIFNAHAAAHTPSIHDQCSTAGGVAGSQPTTPHCMNDAYFPILSLTYRGRGRSQSSHTLPILSENGTNNQSILSETRFHLSRGPYHHAGNPVKNTVKVRPPQGR